MEALCPGDLQHLLRFTARLRSPSGTCDNRARYRMAWATPYRLAGNGGGDCGGPDRRSPQLPPARPERLTDPVPWLVLGSLFRRHCFRDDRALSLVPARSCPALTCVRAASRAHRPPARSMRLPGRAPQPRPLERREHLVDVIDHGLEVEVAGDLHARGRLLNAEPETGEVEKRVHRLLAGAGEPGQEWARGLREPDLLCSPRWIPGRWSAA